MAELQNCRRMNDYDLRGLFMQLNLHDRIRVLTHPQSAWRCLTTLGPSILTKLLLLWCSVSNKFMYPYKYNIQKLAVLMVMLKPNLLKNCFTTTLMHAHPNLVLASPAKYEDVKPVCRLSESSSSLHMLRSHCLPRASTWLKQVAITYKNCSVETAHFCIYCIF